MIDLDRLDVGARHHDVLDAHLAQPQDVVEHRPLAGRKGFGIGRALGQRVGQVLAQAAAVLLPEQAGSQSMKEGRSAVASSAGAAYYRL